MRTLIALGVLVAAAMAAMLIAVDSADVQHHQFSVKPLRLPREGAEKRLAKANARFPKELKRHLKVASLHHQKAGGGLKLKRKKTTDAIGNPKLALPHSLAHHQHQHDQSNGSSVTIPVGELFCQSVLIGNVTVGTPAQGPFQVAFDDYEPDLILINEGATSDDYDWGGGGYDCDSVSISTSSSSSGGGDGTPVIGKTEFNSSASSSFSSNNDSFTDIWDMGTEGVLASDILTLEGSLSANVTFGLADEVDWYLAYVSIDGVLGLESDQPNGDLTPVLKQIAASGQLARPIITRQVNQSLTAWEGVGVITLGSEDPANCRQEFVYPTNTSYFAHPYFNISSVGIAGGGAGNTSRVAVNYTVIILNDFWPLYVNNAVVKLFVEAANATESDDYSIENYCSGDDYPVYTVPCGQLSNASNVELGTAAGGVVIQPADYILPYGDECFLWVLDEALLDYSDCYDYSSSSSSSSGDTTEESSDTTDDDDDGDDDEEEVNWLVLGQLWANHNCISTNIDTGLVGLAPAIAGSDPAPEPEADGDDNTEEDDGDDDE